MQFSLYFYCFEEPDDTNLDVLNFYTNVFYVRSIKKREWENEIQSISENTPFSISTIFLHLLNISSALRNLKISIENSEILIQLFLVLGA
jgi:hypothetical protein